MSDASEAARAVAAVGRIHTVVLVEGDSDRVALETLAARRHRDLASDGVALVPMGGAMSIGRYLDAFGPRGLGLTLAGLCDSGEQPYVARALENAGLGEGLDRDRMRTLGFFVCVADLEDELIRALGPAVVEDVTAAQGDLRALHSFQRQPAQRERTPQQQLRRFMGTTAGRKSHYAKALVDALDLAHVPEPLEELLGHV